MSVFRKRVEGINRQTILALTSRNGVIMPTARAALLLLVTFHCSRLFLIAFYPANVSGSKTPMSIFNREAVSLTAPFSFGVWKKRTLGSMVWFWALVSFL